jgi:Papain-like cysteine protease AvrRpt2
LDTAKFFGGEAAKLVEGQQKIAMQKSTTQDSDKLMKTIKEAQKDGLINEEDASRLTNSLLDKMVGQESKDEKKLTDEAEVKNLLDAASKTSSNVTLSRGGETIDVKKGSEEGVSSFDINIPGDIPVIAQPNPKACWATVATMMLSWRDKLSYTIENAMEIIGKDYKTKFTAGKGLLGSEKPKLLIDMNIGSEPPMNYSVFGLKNLLEAYGPLWVTTDEDPTMGFSIHARIITGIFGNGTIGGTSLRIIDPAGGKKYPETYRDFANKFEAEARALGVRDPLRIQIVHFKETINNTEGGSGTSSSRSNNAFKLIDSYTEFGSLDEEGLATNLLARLPEDSSFVNEVLDQLSFNDRDDVSNILVKKASDSLLTKTGKDTAGNKLLKRLVRELQEGITTDDEATQIERIIRLSSESHARLRKEDWVNSSQIKNALSTSGAKFQSIDSGVGDYLYDEYSIIITKMPSGLTPEDYLKEMANDLNKAINNPAFDNINVFKRITNTGSQPKLGDIYEIDIRGPDNGSVMLVEKTSSYFIFQTIETTTTGSHPEYGSREFGYQSYQNGTVIFYTRGASRPGAWIIGVMGKNPQRVGWTSMMEGIGKELARRGGSVNTAFTVDSWSTHRM